MNPLGISPNGMNPLDMNQMVMNQIGMNQMGMNQMGMNQIDMDQISINPIGMNQIGINQMGMNHKCMNPMCKNYVGRNPLMSLPENPIIFCGPKKHKNMFNDVFELKTLAESLVYFYGFISLKFNNDKIDMTGEKVTVNYYNLLKNDVYLDLSLNIEKLIKTIFWKRFYPSLNKEVIKRTNSNQTT